LALQGREQFIRQYLALEKTIVSLDNEQLEKLVTVMLSGKPLFANYPEFRNPDIAQTIQQIASQIAEYDNSLSVHLLEYNEHVRNLRRYYSKHRGNKIPYVVKIPEELDF